jgi:hypothetical protein
MLVCARCCSSGGSYQDNANANEQDFPRNQPSTPFAFGQLTLVHRHRAGIDARSKARDESANDQVCKREGRGLQCCADDDEAHSKPDHVSAAKHISNGEVENTSEQSAQAVARHCNSSDNVVGVAELLAEGRVFEKAGEHSLVITV